jgi:hypothetical protein
LFFIFFHFDLNMELTIFIEVEQNPVGGPDSTFERLNLQHH